MDERWFGAFDVMPADRHAHSLCRIEEKQQQNVHAYTSTRAHKSSWTEVGTQVFSR